MMFEVVWSEVDSAPVLLGIFADRASADKFAMQLRPNDGEESSIQGVRVASLREIEPAGPSAKWMLSKTWIEPMEQWATMIFLIEPTGPESHRFEEEYRDYAAEICAPNRAEAITRFDGLFGVNFLDESGA